MGIRRRGSKSYFYESVRIKGKPRNFLVASGAAAEACAALAKRAAVRRADEAMERRDALAERRERREEALAACRSIEAEDSSLVDLAGLAEDLVGVAMVEAGYRRRRGEWRRARRRGGDAMSASDVRESGGRETPSPKGSEAEKAANISHILAAQQAAFRFEPGQRDPVRKFVEKIARADHARTEGSDSILPSLIEAYNADPLLMAEESLLRRLAKSGGGGWYGMEYGRLKLEEFKRDLMGPEPTPIERALVESIALARLDLLEVTERLARTEGGPVGVLEHLDRRIGRATKRFHAGLKQLDLVRRKLVPLVSVEVTHNHAEPDSAEKRGKKLGLIG